MFFKRLRRERLGRAAMTFNFAVGFVGLAALGTCLAFELQAGSSPLFRGRPDLPLTFLGLFVFARFMRFEVREDITASLVVPMQLACIWLLGPELTAVLAVLAFLTEVLREHPLHGLEGDRKRFMFGIIAFNLGMEAIVTLSAGGVLGAMKRLATPEGLPPTHLQVFFLMALTFGAFKMVNEALLLGAFWLRGDTVAAYMQGARATIGIEFLTLPLAVLLVLTRNEIFPGGWGIFLITMLLAAVLVQKLTTARAEVATTNAELATTNTDLERRVREVETLSEVSRAISADIELERLLDSIQRNCQRLLPAYQLFIALYSKDSQVLRIALEVIDGEMHEPKEIPLGTGLTSHVILTGEPLLVKDLVTETGELPAEPFRIDDHQPNRSWLGAPMMARGEAVGAICLQDRRASAFDEHDCRLLLSIASQAAISVQNARLHTEALQALIIEAENRELKQLDAKKSEFVNMVAHQFRTPLTTVIGYSSLLRERAQAAEPGEAVRDLERHLDTVHSESKRLSQMVEELLNISRIRSGGLPITVQSFDVNRLVRETIAGHHLLAEEKNHVMRARYGGEDAGEGELPRLSASGDSNFIRQVVTNLLSNALKYAPAGSDVVVRTTVQGDEAIVEVVDEGPGVPPGDLERVFDEFYRAPGATMDEPGTGLGLSISRVIIGAHGGRVWAERRGEGTAFAFALQFIPEDETKKQVDA